MPRWIVVVVLIAGFVAVTAFAAWLAGNARYRVRMAEAEAAWADIASKAAADVARFDPAMVADLPEIARRYFGHAIAPGTPLKTTVELAMDGTFRLGQTGRVQDYAMQARQILAPPDAFVWIARMRNGMFLISGSDALYRGHGWTRFWMFRALPLVQLAATDGLDRAAAARPALESIWAPASLLPQNGVVWEQTGPDTAQIIFADSRVSPVDLTLDATGRVTQIVTQRWSDVNPWQTFRLQPFGGTMRAEATFEGFTIPSDVQVGNNFGTPAFDGFFIGTITAARYR
jgi:hypothetical protein